MTSPRDAGRTTNLGSQRAAPVVRFDNLVTGTSKILSGYLREIRADTLDEVRAALDDSARAAQSGLWVGGFVSYDAAPAFDDALRVVAPSAGPVPLAWFGVFKGSDGTSWTPRPPRRVAPLNWRIALDQSEYERRVELVRDQIRAGEVYQANLTTRATTSDVLDASALYQRLLVTQRPAYGTLISHHDFAIASASPELFFEWSHSRLRCRPMKGTQRRGRFDDEDQSLATQLACSPKEQSENIMIVDLVRNDMAKVAQLGTVKVQSLLEVEPYPNVWQLVSEITCRTVPTTSLSDVFAALFPSGSVTGAPKASAMSLIASLEDSARGVYCGAVGLLEPSDDGYHATFNVAIRTAVATARGGEFGTGGGIVFDSEPAREYAEMALKAQQLQAPSAHFRLLETFRHVPQESTGIAQRHLARLRRSARDLGFLVPEDLTARVRRRLDTVPYEARVRVLVSTNGRLSIQVAPVPVSPEARVRLAIDDEPVESSDPFLFHKTTRREVYNRRRRRFPDVDDVVMVNERGECTEATTSNLAIQRGGRWLTPPLTSGCLPGIARAMLLERGELVEAVVHVADLETAEDIAIINSLRGWRRAELVAPTSLVAPRRN